MPSVFRSGSFNLWNPQGLPRPVQGLLYLHYINNRGEVTKKAVTEPYFAIYVHFILSGAL
jgi:hypothetical protein